MTKNNKDFVKKTKIPGLFIIDRPSFVDERGFFREVARLSDLEISEVDFKPKQLNHSFSKPKVIRGLHAESWNKLIYPITGEVFIAIVDIRVESKTFAQVETFVFDENNRNALFITKGLANSFCVMGQDPVHYLYLVDKYYEGSDERAVAWDDPDLDINWPVENPIISEKDKNNPKLKELFPEKFK